MFAARLIWCNVRLYKLVPDATANQPPVIDRATLLEELASDEDLFREIIGLFRETGPGQLQAVREAAAARDGSLLSRHAHTIKGALAQLHADSAAAAARDVEEAARTGQTAAAVAAVPRLETEMAAVLREVDSILNGA